MKTPNQGLDLTNPDAAQSVPIGPLCLLSGLAAQAHVGLSQGTPATASVASLRDLAFRSSESAWGASGRFAEQHLLRHGTSGLMDIRFDLTAPRKRRSFGDSGDFGAPGLRYARTSVRGDFGALASTVCRRLHNPPGLRGTGLYGLQQAPQSAGTPVRRDFGALASTVCSKLYSSPGLRCARTSVHWALRLRVPGNTSAAPAASVPRTGSAILAPFAGEPPPESPASRRPRSLDPSGTTVAPLPGAR